MSVKRSARTSRRELLNSIAAGTIAGGLACAQSRGAQMPRILVFDVNETLLDLKALEPHFQRSFGDAGMLREWFNQVIAFAEALTLSGEYRPFGDIARAALEMTAAAQKVRLAPEDTQQIIGGIGSLPPHPEVPKALGRLKSAGFRMVTLTNSPPAVVDAQMKRGDLQQYFERNFSVDSVRRYKPAPEPYQMVARELAVPIGQLRMIAAHAWDVGGAMRAGCAAAFVARSGKAVFPLFPQVDIIGADLEEVSESIIRVELPEGR